MRCLIMNLLVVFFFNDTATTEIYTLSLHDALPIFDVDGVLVDSYRAHFESWLAMAREDRKSTRLNSSHGYISYAGFCLKKKTNRRFNTPTQRRISDYQSPRCNFGVF